MSVSNLKEYARRCASESELRERARTFGLDNVEAHITLAKSMDLDWSMDDMMAFRKEMVNAEARHRRISARRAASGRGRSGNTTAELRRG